LYNLLVETRTRRPQHKVTLKHYRTPASPAVNTFLPGLLQEEFLQNIGKI